MSKLAPIALFIYNRPEHTSRILASLASDPLASESDLVIYADGPKNEQHQSLVHAARAEARAARRFKSVRLVERHRNLGLAQSIITGVAELCAERGRVIVLEDDLLVAPQFLTFLNDGLERYERETGVFQVSGYMFPVSTNLTQRGLFLPLISCWGWGTWQRAWSQFDTSAAGYAELYNDRDLQDRFNLNGHYDYFGMLRDQVEGKIDSWGVRWLLSVFLKNGLVLYPTKSLVQNTGVDGTGTHGKGTAHFQTALEVDVGAPTYQHAWPDNIEVDAVALDRVKTLLSSSSRSHPIKRIIRRLLQ